MTHKRLIIFATLSLLLAAILFVTLGPAGWRPRTGYDQAERIAAFAALGGLIWLALRSRPTLAVFSVVAIALGMELAQAAMPGRHPEVLTALLKALGGVLGCILASLALNTMTKRDRGRLVERRSILSYSGALLAVSAAILVTWRYMNMYGAQGIRFPWL